VNETETIESLTKAVLEALEDKKSIHPIVLDVRGRSMVTDRFIIATGRSDRHLKALGNAVSEVAHRFGLPATIEGLAALEWLLVDLGDVVVHLFLPEVRDAFQLESLWAVPSAQEPEQDVSGH
jgi:ribosome-associated protein